MDCLRNLIIVDWCGEDTTLLPVSNQYLSINALPGISFKKIVMLANDEQRHWKGVWDNVTLRATKRFALDVRQLMNKRYKLRTATQALTLGSNIDLTSTTNTATQYRGFVIELNDGNDYAVASNMQVISIERLNYYHNNAPQAGLQFKVYDLDSGLELDSFTKDVVAGWNIINYKKKFNTLTRDFPKRIFVCFAGGTNDSPTHTLPYNIDYNYSGGSAVIRGATATVAATINYAALTTGTNIYGLSAMITVGCSWEGLVCMNTDLFAVPFWYLCGIELMNEQINSDRLNQYTTINIAKAKELRAQYEVMYMGGTQDSIVHDGALTQAVDGIDLSLTDECLECGDSIQIRESRL